MTIAECASDEPYSTQIGPFGKALMASEYTTSGVPVLRGVNISQGRFLDGSFVFISDEAADRLDKYESFPDDVLLVHKGTLGQVGIMPRVRKHDRYIMGNSMLRVRCNTAKLLPEFLYYWLSSGEGQHYLYSRMSQVGVPQLQTPLRTLREAVLSVPPIDVQQRIVAVLGALDDKIELNRRMNRTLESIVRAVFKSWFVDFDPVRKKMEGKTGDELGIPPDLAVLYPSNLVASSVGPVPSGWPVIPLGESFEVTMGQSPPGETYNETGVGLPFYQGRRDFGERYPSRRVFCSAPKRLAYAEDTLVSVRAPVGDINLATETCCVGRGVAAVRHRSGAPNYTYEMMRSLSAVFTDYEAGGTVFGAISSRQIASLAIIEPPSLLLRAFESLTAPLGQCLRLLACESAALAAIRDALLPKLLSGELRADEVEDADEPLREVPA